MKYALGAAEDIGWILLVVAIMLAAYIAIS
jgi:hypothetical protein